MSRDAGRRAFRQKSGRNWNSLKAFCAGGEKTSRKDSECKRRCSGEESQSTVFFEANVAHQWCRCATVGFDPPRLGHWPRHPPLSKRGQRAAEGGGPYKGTDVRIPTPRNDKGGAGRAHEERPAPPPFSRQAGRDERGGPEGRGDTAGLRAARSIQQIYARTERRPEQARRGAREAERQRRANGSRGRGGNRRATTRRKTTIPPPRPLAEAPPFTQGGATHRRECSGRKAGRRGRRPLQGDGGLRIPTASVRAG